jgi:hypothetical protein
MVLLDARKHLDALTWAWTESLDLLDVENSRYLREDIARAVTRVVSGPGRWEKQDIERLTKARDLLNENSVDDSSAPAVQRALDPLTLATPPWVRSLLAFGAINLLGAGVYFLAVRIGGLGRWLPFAVPVVTGLGVGAADARDFAQQVFKTDARLLLGLLAAEGLVLVAAGVASPGVLRALARTEPFNRVVVPLAMRIPWSRRRFFRDYVRGVRQWLALSRERAAGEQYAPLPATVRSDDQRESALSADPAAAVLRQLTADVDQPGAVLVAAPGGRGKSALLRAVVERALDAFERHPARAPLPVVPSATRATVLETLATALGPELASPEFLPLHLAAGDFFLVLDGVTEVGPAAEEIDAFVRSDGRRTPVLLAARPDPGYEDAVRRFPHWLAAEPVPLDDAALDQFVEHYGGAPFSPELRSACRGPDGYVPLLVRMTMTVAGGAGEPRTIADVYYAHFIRLFDAQFRGDEQKKISQLQAAARWCLDTYWRDGRRRLPFDGAELPSALLRAGVLVGAGAGGTPREVAFFHDSVQSYLTAYGLWRLDADGYKNPPACPPGMVWELPRVLLRAAGVPAFTRAQTVIVTAGGSELFQMCVAVFGAGRLRPVLRDELLRWARDHEENLRRQDVLGTLPPGVRATAEKKRGVTNVLTAAAEEAFRLDGSDGGARRLAQIYSGLAPEVCILEHVQDPQG